MRVLIFMASIAALAVAGCGQDGGANNETVPTNNEAAVGAPDVTVLGAALSGDAAKKLMHERHENMEKIGDTTKAIGRTLKTDAPDMAVIKSGAQRIAQLSPEVAEWFPAGTGPGQGKTHAKAEIWQKPADFLAKAKDFDAAAQAFNQAAAGNDLAAINTTFSAMMKTCKSCHEPYRHKDD